MDLFPDGGFVRLRNRARDKYVHADEDASGVSLRPLGAAPFRNVVWRAKVWAVEGVNYLLLEGAAYGRYLAVPNEDEHAPSGHRGVRAVQLDFNSLNLKDSLMWLAIRVEAGQNYVRLRNDQRYLRAQGTARANGRHRYWNNLVTIDVRNGNETTMMQWRVEAIPSTPELLPLPPPPQPPCKEADCCACGCEGSTPLCRRCAGHLKRKLLDVAKTKLDIECAQRHCYCLDCKEIVTGTHPEHRNKTLPLGYYKKQLVTWVTGEEIWRGIFERIESQDGAIKPYLLYNKSGYPQCKVCNDIVSEDKLYGVLWPGAGGRIREKAIVGMQDSGDPIGFCLTCATVVIRYGMKEHNGHDWLRIQRNSGGLSPRLIIPDGHAKEKPWACIKKQGPANNEVLVRDDSSVRCKECRKRLATAGDTCSLQCSLDAACREPQLLPRSLQLKTSTA